MATVTTGAETALNMSTLKFPDRSSYNEVDNPTGSAIRFWYDDGTSDHLANYTKLVGSNLKIANLTGTINKIIVVSPDDVNTTINEAVDLTFNGLNMPLREFYGYFTRTDGTGTEAFLQKALVGDDTVTGSNVDDVLRGLNGNDTLTGGIGADAFVFQTALNPTSNVDTITDFSSTDDTIYLEDSVFTGLVADPTDGLGLQDGMFVANLTGKATSASGTAQIVYETDTGRLFYDADGSGGAAGIRFAKVGIDLVLTSSDLHLI